MDVFYVICAVATADLCELHRIRMHGADQIACTMTSAAELARFIPDGWNVARYQCVPMGADAPFDAAAN